MKALITSLLFLITFQVFPQQLSENIRLVDRIVNLDRPWGAEFLPDGKLLVSEMEGTLKLFDAGFTLLTKLSKPEDLDQRRIARFDNAGAFDVAVDPDFSKSRFVYWSYAAKSDDISYLKVVRLKLNHSFGTPETIFTARPAGSDRFHYGGALLFDDKGNLLIATGERFSTARSQGDNPVAQDPSDSRGKIWLVPDPASHLGKDNDPEPHIIATGLRNVQAMVSLDNKIWLADHGPIMGDELNILQLNKNYGWPIITSGKYKTENYQPVETSNKSFTPPLYEWRKFTMAPSGLMYYDANRWPAWKGRMFVSGLSSGRLLALEIQGDEVISETLLIIGLRQRDVIQSPDGRIFILSDETKGRLIEVMFD